MAQLSANGSELIRSTMLEGCEAIDVAATDSAIYAASDNTGEGLVVRIKDSVTASPRIDRVANAFSGTGFGVSPGELVSREGAGLGPLTAVDLGISPENKLPLDLAGTQVLFNGRPVPLMRAAADCVIFAAPLDIDGVAATMQIQRGGVLSNDSIEIRKAGPSRRGEETRGSACALLLRRT